MSFPPIYGKKSAELATLPTVVSPRKNHEDFPCAPGPFLLPDRRWLHVPFQVGHRAAFPGGNVDLGRVVQVRTVEIDGEKTLLGLTGGAALGGAAAYPGAGANTGDYVVQAAASVVGAIAGQAVEELATREQGQELTIVLDNGSTVVVVQETDDGFFREGDRVQVNHSRTGETSVRIALN